VSVSGAHSSVMESWVPVVGEGSMTRDEGRAEPTSKNRRRHQPQIIFNLRLILIYLLSKVQYSSFVGQSIIRNILQYEPPLPFL
jgi:hypothetical protein